MVSNRYRLKTGFTLVEILVALAISLLLISGLISVLLSSKQSYLRKETINQMQENLRVASDSLRKIISMAESVEEGSSQAGIIVNYSGGEGMLNCLGQPVSSGHIVSYFHVKKDVLYCSSRYPPTAGSQQALVEGISAMQVAYGVDSDGDGQLDEYMSLPKKWNAVISVRILLRLIDSGSQQRPEVTLTVAMRPRIFARLAGDF